MNKYLIKLANHLDKKGLHKEADYVDWIMKNAEDNISGLDSNTKILQFSNYKISDKDFSILKEILKSKQDIPKALDFEEYVKTEDKKKYLSGKYNSDCIFIYKNKLYYFNNTYNIFLKAEITNDNLKNALDVIVKKLS